MKFCMHLSQDDFHPSLIFQLKRTIDFNRKVISLQISFQSSSPHRCLFPRNKTETRVLFLWATTKPAHVQAVSKAWTAPRLWRPPQVSRKKRVAEAANHKFPICFLVLEFVSSSSAALFIVLTHIPSDEDFPKRAPLWVHVYTPLIENSEVWRWGPSRGSRILARGPSVVLTPRGGALSPKYARNKGFPLKLPENCMILKISWGQGCGPGPPGPPGPLLGPECLFSPTTPWAFMPAWELCANDEK